jgi:hypothetical protein
MGWPNPQGRRRYPQGSCGAHRLASLSLSLSLCMDTAAGRRGYTSPVQPSPPRIVHHLLWTSHAAQTLDGNNAVCNSVSPGCLSSEQWPSSTRFAPLRSGESALLGVGASSTGRYASLSRLRSPRHRWFHPWSLPTVSCLLSPCIILVNSSGSLVLAQRRPLPRTPLR